MMVLLDFILIFCFVPVNHSIFTNQSFSDIESLDPIRQLYTAHVGDSRAVLCRGGVGVRLTSLSDHRAGDQEEARQVMERGGMIINERVNGSLSVTRALGDRFLKAPFLEGNAVSPVPHITVVDLTPSDPFLVLACDGLWDVMTEQEAVNLVMEGWMKTQSSIMMDDGTVGGQVHTSTFCEIMARMLVEEALSRGSTDNVTVQVVLL